MTAKQTCLKLFQSSPISRRTTAIGNASGSCNKSRAIAGITARCAEYMSAQIIM